MTPYHLRNHLFKLIMWWRILYGALRTIVGIVIWQLVGTPIISLIDKLIHHHELRYLPDQLLYQLSQTVLTPHPFYITYFLAFYLIFWGVVDVVLSYSLLRHQPWAFPTTIVLIFAFVLYEIVRFTYTHSLLLLGIIFVDIVIGWLVFREYNQIQQK